MGQGGTRLSGTANLETQGGEKNTLSRSAMFSETFRYIAKLALEAKRYDDMLEAMKTLAMMGVEFTLEERSLLSVGTKSVIDSMRASLRILDTIKKKEKSRGNKLNAKRIKKYRHKVVSKFTNICNDIMAVIDKYLLPACTDGEASVFYYKMKGDYYRYLAEFKRGAARKEVVDHALKAYEKATSTADAKLEAAHPIRLGLALNFSVFCYEIMNSPERACHLAKQAYVKAISEADDFNDESSYKDVGSILQLLRDNLTLWVSNMPEDGEDSEDVDGDDRDGGGEESDCEIVEQEDSIDETPHLDEISEGMKGNVIDKNHLPIVDEEGKMFESNMKIVEFKESDVIKVDTGHPFMTDRVSEGQVFEMNVKFVHENFREFVLDIQDVQADGNCGYRSIAVALGRPEEDYTSIRQELVHELKSNVEHYDNIFRLKGHTQYLIKRVDWKHGMCVPEYWLETPTMLWAIAERYNAVVILFSEGTLDASHMTCFPTRQPPEILPPILICILYRRNHYLCVKLKDDCPLPTLIYPWEEVAPTISTEFSAVWMNLFRTRLNVGVALLR